MTEAEQAPTGILCLVPTGPLVVAATDGTEIIANAKSVFPGAIDPDFEEYGLCEASDATLEIQIALYEIAQDATFVRIFGSLGGTTEQLCLTQSQIIAFVKMYREHLRKVGGATFFLFKSKRGGFYVAYVYFYYGCLAVNVGRFGQVTSWPAKELHRIVVPQL